MGIDTEKGFKAKVNNIVEKSRHGPYAVAKIKGVAGSVTFSLNSKVWREPSRPEPGVYVYLERIEERRAGRRAMFGRLWRVSDEQDLESKQPTKSARKPYESQRD